MQENPLKFKKFKKIPLLMSIIFLTFSCFIFVFFYKKLNDNKIIAQEMQQEWQTEAARRDEIKYLAKSLKAIEAERNLLESHFAQSSNIVPFLDTIEQLGILARAKSEVVSVDIPKDKNVLLIDVKASGSFEALYKFLTLLENSPYELDFTAVNIQRINIQTMADKKFIPAEWEAAFKIKLLSFTQ